MMSRSFRFRQYPVERNHFSAAQAVFGTAARTWSFGRGLVAFLNFCRRADDKKVATSWNAWVTEVRRVCAPMFMLFDFQEFAREVYEDIVRRYEKGEST
jgi:hypothetical protein